MLPGGKCNHKLQTQLLNENQIYSTKTNNSYPYSASPCSQTHTDPAVIAHAHTEKEATFGSAHPVQESDTLDKI